MEVKLTGGGGKREGGVSSLSLCYAPHGKYDAANGTPSTVAIYPTYCSNSHVTVIKRPRLTLSSFSSTLCPRGGFGGMLFNQASYWDFKSLDWAIVLSETL
ncbi:hypothetical protein MTR_1g073630 [Medicago truncatula]|uniref:Uncharacterized protein n=1 Tax=Medicago truncatula TaxID=3880 RepID=A0A072VKY2_MEDTR|nr:hypothetical protein MTR_1g073630 [Medicago truncatula]